MHTAKSMPQSLPTPRLGLCLTFLEFECKCHWNCHYFWVSNSICGNLHFEIEAITGTTANFNSRQAKHHKIRSVTKSYTIELSLFATGEDQSSRYVPANMWHQRNPPLQWSGLTMIWMTVWHFACVLPFQRSFNSNSTALFSRCNPV